MILLMVEIFQNPIFSILYYRISKGHAGFLSLAVGASRPSEAPSRVRTRDMGCAWTRSTRSWRTATRHGLMASVSKDGSTIVAG